LTDQEKPHWVKLKDLIWEMQNGEAIIKFQDGLPVLVVEIKGEKTNINLLK